MNHVITQHTTIYIQTAEPLSTVLNFLKTRQAKGVITR